MMVTPNHKMPQHLRKSARSPSCKSDEFNEYVVGKYRTAKLVASLERAGHQTMIAQINCAIRAAKVLSAELKQELQAELKWRKQECKRLDRVVDNSQRALDAQFAKPNAPKDQERLAPTVPGPSGKRVQHDSDADDPHPFARRRVLNTTDGLVHSMGYKAPASVKINVHATAWFPRVNALSRNRETQEDAHDE